MCRTEGKYRKEKLGREACPSPRLRFRLVPEVVADHWIAEGLLGCPCQSWRTGPRPQEGGVWGAGTLRLLGKSTESGHQDPECWGGVHTGQGRVRRAMGTTLWAQANQHGKDKGQGAAAGTGPGTSHAHAERTAVKWSLGRDCGVTERLCALDTQLGQSTTGVPTHSHHA